MRRVAEGPEAKGWTPFEAALLRAADELYVNAFVSDATWNTLAARYDQKHLVDTVFAVAEYTMLAAAMNTFGVQPDEGLTARMPVEIPRRTAVTTVTHAQIQLPKARIPAARTIGIHTRRARHARSDPFRPAGGVRLPDLRAAPRLTRRDNTCPNTSAWDSTLTARTREMLILRIGWLCQSEYEWSNHEPGGRRAGMTDDEIRGPPRGPDAPVWDRVDAAILRAADEPPP